MISIPSPSPSPPRMDSPHLASPHHTDSPTQIDIHHDLFPDYYGGSASIPSEPQKDELFETHAANGTESHEPLGSETHDPHGSETNVPHGIETHFPHGSETHVPHGSETHVPHGSDTHVPLGSDTHVPHGSETHVPHGNETHVPNGSDDFSLPINENKSPIPVQLGASGEGLPYAPVDWPNPGDIWGWKVGRRVTSSGFFNDRFLMVPKSLQMPKSPKMFASKPSLERFIRSQIPDADLDAFFASFVWKIPAVLETPTKVIAMDAAKGSEQKTDAANGSGQDVAASGRPKRTRAPRAPETPQAAPSSQKRSAPKSSNSKKKQRTTKEPTKTKPRRQTRQQLKDFAPAQPEDEDVNGGLDLSFLDDEKTREEFDTYLSSLDDILAKPLNEEPIDLQLMHNSFSIEENEMAETRKKLSSLLDMDFPSMICFKDLDELTRLASRLRKDPTLTAEQLVKLKLIEEIPTFCEVFLENRETMEQADRFFSTLEDNKAKVTSLRQEYSGLKQQVTQLQSEVDSNLLTVKEIDSQIAQLKSRRAELTRIVDKKKYDKDELTYNQKLVANSIPKVVHEVQLANTKLPEWELKKENAERREAEILAKFAPLKGFSL